MALVTIQMRRGLKVDFDPQKMLPGEWAVSIDPETENQIVWMCFKAGVVKRMGTYEDFRAQIEEATDDIREQYTDTFNEIKLYMEGLAAETGQNKDTAVQKAQEASASASSALSSKEAAAASERAASQKADKAYTSAANAQKSADSSEEYSLLSKSYAQGDSGVREDENTDNAKYYYERTKQISFGAQGALLPMGTIAFSQLDTSEKHSGYMYNITDSFTTDARFKEGAGYIYPPGTNVYYTPDGYWDCFFGALTDISDKTVSFTEDSDSYEFSSGETTSVLLGKIRKLLNTIKQKAPYFLSGGRVPLADQWTNTRYLEGMGVNGASDIHFVCDCSSPSSSPVKTVDKPEFVLKDGARLIVSFENGNAAPNPTLDVNGTGAKPIYYKGAAIPEKYIYSGAVFELVYIISSGAGRWHVVGDLTQSQVDSLKDWGADLELQVTAIEEIVRKDMEKLQVTLNDNYQWVPNGDSIGMVQEPGDCQCTDVLVDGGKTYVVRTCYSPSGISEGHLIYAANRIGSHYDFADIQEIPVSLKEGRHEYWVTVPEGCNCLLINNDYYVQEIEIYGFTNGGNGDDGASSGMKILWSGLLNCDGYVGLNNEGVEFSIPKDCFFNDGKELILAINGYCPEDHFSTFPLLITGMCFGTDEDFGFSPNSGQYPYKCGDFSRYILHEERFVTESSSNYSVIRIDVHVKKVADSRYAVCTAQNRSSHFYITSISAVLAG